METINDKLISIDEDDIINGKIVLDDDIRVILERVFYLTGSLETIDLPSKLKEIGKFGFAYCSNLKTIQFPEGIEKIGIHAFFNDLQLESVKLPDSIKILGDSAFERCVSLTSVKLPNNLTYISKELFSGCFCLRSVEFPKKLKAIEYGAFLTTAISDLNLPDTVERIGEEAFYGCDGLEHIVLPKNLKRIENSAFYNCSHLESVELPQGLEYIGESAFYSCENLKSIIIPSSVKYLKKDALSNCSKLKNVTLYSDTVVSNQTFADDVVITIINPRTNEKKIIIKGEEYKKLVPKNEHEYIVDLEYYYFRFYVDDLEGVFIQSYDKCYFFDKDDKWIESGELEYSVAQIRALHEWKKRGKFLPHSSIIENMPIEEIDNFYNKKNSKKWAELVSLAKVDLDEEKGAFFKICYALGLFEEKGKISDRAYEFIKKDLIGSVDNGEYHIRFGGLNIRRNKFNPTFAELVFKNYIKDEVEDGFLYFRDEFNASKIDCFSSVYNNFNRILEAHPNRSVNTNRRADELTPQMCVDFVNSREYEEVHEGNEELAKNVGMYGYTQEEFEGVQRLFDEGKNLPQSEITLFANDDEESNLVYYQLLDKNNPLGVVLGDITNCCQTINGVGQECLEYGISQRNSKFMVFKSGSKIVGQSWVWYDEKIKKICLDNIEVPKSIISSELKEEKYQKEFINCLKRSVEGFLIAMENRGLEVNSITIGEGYNDIQELLEVFERIEGAITLSDYKGYSDAKNQYVLYKKLK